MILTTNGRVTLRSMTREEYHRVRQQYVPDPIMDPGPYAYIKEREDEKYDSLLARESWYPCVGIFLQNNEIIGQVSFKRIDLEKSRCELGIALANDSYKGKGYGAEAFALALSYALEVLGLQNIYADTMGSNIRMRRILDRLGFQCFSCISECYDMKDRWEDRLDYVYIQKQ